MPFWSNHDDALEKELDEWAAERLNRDVEKRRKNAWLRKVGFITRIFVYPCVYACLLGLLFVFVPEGVSEGWITKRPFAELTIGDVAAAALWWLAAAYLVRTGFIMFRALFSPNPRPDFREHWGYFGLALFAVTLIIAAVPSLRAGAMAVVSALLRHSMV
jgi:hypothetical protein